MIHRPVSRHRNQAFSLIELVIALGVLQFCCIALLGVMQVGLSSLRSSTETSLHATIASTVVGNIRQMQSDPGQLAGIAGKTWYFDYDGAETAAASAVLSARVVADSSTSLPVGAASVTAFQIEISRPDQAVGTGTTVSFPFLVTPFKAPEL